MAVLLLLRVLTSSILMTLGYRFCRETRRRGGEEWGGRRKFNTFSTRNERRGMAITGMVRSAHHRPLLPLPLLPQLPRPPRLLHPPHRRQSRPPGTVASYSKTLKVAGPRVLGRRISNQRRRRRRRKTKRLRAKGRKIVMTPMPGKIQ